MKNLIEKWRNEEKYLKRDEIMAEILIRLNEKLNEILKFTREKEKDDVT